MLSVIHSLIEEIIILLEKQFDNNNLRFIQEILINNNYPIEMINKSIQK